MGKGRGDLASGIGLGAASRRHVSTCTYVYVWTCLYVHVCMFGHAHRSTTNADWFSPSAKTGLSLGLIRALAPNSDDMGQETLCTSSSVKWG